MPPWKFRGNANVELTGSSLNYAKRSHTSEQSAGQTSQEKTQGLVRIGVIHKRLRTSDMIDQITIRIKGPSVPADHCLSHAPMRPGPVSIPQGPSSIRVELVHQLWRFKFHVIYARASSWCVTSS